jgi:hypothetical protein
MSGIFYRNIVLMLVSIAVIPIVSYLNVPSLSTKIRLIWPRLNSPRMGAVVEAEVYVVAEVALVVEAVAMVVIEPTPAASGRAMMLWCFSAYHKWWHRKTQRKMEHGLQILQVEYHSYYWISRQMGC